MKRMLVAQTAIRPEWEAEYNAWYSTDGVELLALCRAL